MYILVDLLVDLSVSGGVLQNPENPPPLATALYAIILSLYYTVERFLLADSKFSDFIISADWRGFNLAISTSAPSYNALSSY